VLSQAVRAGGHLTAATFQKATADTSTTLALHDATGEHPTTTQDLLALAQDNVVGAEHTS
jgi:hypothetical protein